jgi:hypothetical protein
MSLKMTPNYKRIPLIAGISYDLYLIRAMDIQEREDLYFKSTRILGITEIP